MQAVANTKERKSMRNRRKSARGSQEWQQGKLLPSHLKQESMQDQEENEEKDRNRLDKSNLQLFFEKTHTNCLYYPSSFALIRDLPHLEHSYVTVEHLRQPSFPVLSYRVKQLTHFISLILQSNRHAQQCYPETALQSLISIIAEHYNSVSYHNFSHAFNLMLINYQCIERQSALKKLYTEEELFYIIIAAISHDLGHKGTNNQFEIKCKTELARISNNQSVLENMHVRTLWRILEQNPHLNFLLQATDEKKARHIITRLILNTDMAYHTCNLEKFRFLKNSNSLILNADSDHKWFVMEEIFHASDIGNPCLDYDVYMSWAALLTYEFDEQARVEEKMGVEVTRCFIYKNMNSLYADQEWFLGNIVQPLWKEIADVFPNLTIFTNTIEHNLRKIKEETRTYCQE